MRILVIGAGGREHALVWKLSCSQSVKEIYAVPGNGGISEIANCVEIKPQDINSLMNFVKERKIDLTVVGPEAPLVSGIVDVFEEKNLRIFGPQKMAAQLEGSKVYAKRFMKEFNIPTADFEIFDDYKKAREFILGERYPLVIKADGLCGGKGAFVVGNFSQAEEALRKIMQERIFGASGDRVVIEKFLPGEETSIIAISDGENIVPLASSQDHKRVFDNDRGPNTGGMGAYSPAPVAEGEVFQKAVKKILQPAIQGMAERGFPFRGVLYAGIMIIEGEPYVLEFNVRFGDPETQAILPRMESDLGELINAALEGRLDKYEIKWSPRACVTVVLASGGYPGSYDKGKEISGLEAVRELKDVVIFHAGTKKVKKGSQEIYVTNGGRVLNVAALGSSIKEAKGKAYEAINLITFDKMHYRKDISDKALRREKTEVG